MPIDPRFEPDDICVYPGCPNRRKPGRSLCPLHAAQADREAKRLADEERQRGWPPSQVEGSDA